MAQEKSHSKAFEAATLTLDLVVDRSSLAASMRRLLDGSRRKRVRDFFTGALDRVCAQGSVFCESMSEHCKVLVTTARLRPEDKP